MKNGITLLCAILLLLASDVKAASSDSIFMIGTTAKSPDAAVSAIESYVKRKKWVYLGASKVKKGAVRLVKVCIPAVGRIIWPAGLHLSALLPCGNIGIYRKGTRTEISVLHPRYMHMLYPDAATERAASIAEPLLTELLLAVTK